METCKGCQGDSEEADCAEEEEAATSHVSGCIMTRNGLIQKR